MVDVGGFRIFGGLLYFGPAMPGQANGEPDPALIDPRLAVRYPADRAGAGLGYWPSYSRIPAASRAAYLEWLVAGRNHPNIPIGYVFLYFYGLERRVIVDCREPGPARAELSLIRAEIERLLAIYGGTSSFGSYARNLLGVLDFVAGLHIDDDAPPVFSGEKWPVPFSLRAGLGQYSRSGAPVPVKWALAWARFHPEIYPRTPAIRCRPEFERLFALRYAARFGAGLRVAPNKTLLSLEYRAASSALRTVSLQTDVPDVFQLAVPSRKLAALAEECTEALDAYSRWLGRFPGSEDTPAAVALLPPEIADTDGGPLGRFLGWAADHLRSNDCALVDSAALAGAWAAGVKTKLSPQETGVLCRFLAEHGIGVEPDPRFVSPGPSTESYVLFRADSSALETAASEQYAAAAVLVQLSAAVAAADPSSGAEQEYLVDHLGTGLGLSPGELRRLRARLELLSGDQVKLTGLTAQLAELSPEQRDLIARFCLEVAAADGSVAPGEIKVLTKIYKLLGVPTDRITAAGRAGGASVTRPLAGGSDGPIPLLPAQRGSGRHALPRSTDVSDPATTSAATVPPTVALDPAAIAAKLAESSQVGALLNAIFADDAKQPEPSAIVRRDDSPPIAGLDGAHSELLRELATRGRWSRGGMEDLCARLGLLPDGALDTLNDAALDRTGDPVVEGEDPLTINDDTLQEMLR